MYIVAEIYESKYDPSTMRELQQESKHLDKPEYTGGDLKEAKEAAKVAAIQNPSKVYTIFSPMMEIRAKIDEMVEEVSLP